MAAMAATSGSSAITPPGLQLAQKPRNDPNLGIDLTEGVSDDDGSSGIDADSASSESDDSDAESDSHNSIDDTSNALASAPGNASDTELATASTLASPRTETISAQGGRMLATSNNEGPLAEQTSNADDSAINDTTSEAPASSAGNPNTAYRPLRSMPPPTPQYGRQLAPRGSPLDTYRGKDGIPGYKPKLLQPDDGRVTATVPHKLRGKTDTSNGNFATIYMDLPTTTRQERMSAAQRSSEATVAAAAKANQASTERTTRAGHPRTKRMSAPADGAVAGQAQPPQVSAYYGFPARMPLPHETKMEQARLLSLFRSIHPASIVDQLCKGIGYFGGVPGAPPPPGGAFPLSESFNGAGALFISWLSEVFPPVYPAPSGSAPEQPSMTTQSAQNGIPSQPGSSRAEPQRAAAGPQIDRVMVPKRKRGRPKGSKSSKPRKDKGIKKGPNLNRAPAGSSVELGRQEGAIGDPITAAPSQSSSAAPIEPQPRLGDNLYMTPNGKRRGRPPGSKNKPKAAPLAEINKAIAQAAPARDDSDSPSLRHTLPNDSSPTSSQSVSQSQPDLSIASVVQPTFPSPPVPSTIVLPPQLSSLRKRRLSNSIDDASHNDGGQAAAQQALAPSTNSQEHTNSAPSQKRRRTSNSTALQDRPAEKDQTQSSATSAVTVSPGVGLTGSIDPPLQTASGSSFDNGTQMGQVAGTKQLGHSQSGNGQSRNGQSRAQQTPTVNTQSQRWQNAGPGQSKSPSTVQSLQRPAKQPIGASAAALAPSPTSARQPNYGATQLQQQRPSQAAPSWQRNMVGPQQAANPDAQPMAQLSRHGPEQQQRR